MQIGEPLRTVVAEPLELPVGEPTAEPDPAPHAPDSAYSPAGLDCLIEISKRYYDRRRQERTLKKGDRVAVLGRGIAVVGRADNNWIQAVVWNKRTLRIARKEIVWDEYNMRWEADAMDVRETGNCVPSDR